MTNEKTYVVKIGDRYYYKVSKGRVYTGWHLSSAKLIPGWKLQKELDLLVKYKKTGSLHLVSTMHQLPVVLDDQDLENYLENEFLRIFNSEQ